MLRLLVNSLAKEFYQQHAGLFLTGFYLLFGIVEPSQLIGYHKALLLSGVSSPIGLVVVSVSWILYTVKVHYFLKQKLSLAQYNFVNELGTLERNSQLRLWMALYCVLLIPIIIYVIALTGISIYNELYLSLICILTIFAAFTTTISFLSYRSVTFGFLKEERHQINPIIKVRRPFFSWPLFYLIKEQPLMLLMCKALSLVFFKCMLWMFADVGHDTRVLLVALLASILCHATLVLTLLKFETTNLNFSKSLPISTYRRLLGWLLTLAIILIPEWIFLILSSEYDVYAIANGLVFGMAASLFLVAFLYFIRLNMSGYLRGLLFFFFIAMWSILAHYYLLFSLFLLGGCALYYLLNYNRIDLKVEE